MHGTFGYLSLGHFLIHAFGFGGSGHFNTDRIHDDSQSLSPFSFPASTAVQRGHLFCC